MTVLGLIISICSYDCDDDEDDDGMDIPDGGKVEDAVAQAKGVANALREGTIDPFDHIAAGLRELNMENYDNEEDGTCLSALI